MRKILIEDRLSFKFKRKIFFIELNLNLPILVRYTLSGIISF